MMSFVWLLLGALLALVFFALGGHQRDKVWSTALKLPRIMQPYELVKTHNIDVHLTWRRLDDELTRSRLDPEYIWKRPKERKNGTKEC